MKLIRKYAPVCVLMKLIIRHSKIHTTIFLSILICSNFVYADELFRSLLPNEKIDLISNVSSNCSIHFKEQTTKLTNQYIQKLCSCIGREMADLLVPFDIIEEQQKNAYRVVDYKTSFRQIQKLAYLNCKSNH